MPTNTTEPLLSRLRQFESGLRTLPQSFLERIRHAMRWASSWLALLTRSAFEGMRLIQRLVGCGISTASGLGRCVGLLIQNRPRCQFRLQKAPGQWPALACVAACLLTGAITLSPSVESLWSQQTYPAITALDRTLSWYGLSVGPEEETPTVVRRPMIAVVFGRIMPDDSVEEPEKEIPVASTNSMPDPEPVKLQDITRPVYWQRTPTAKPVASEAFEIRN